jgi:hypothetical protein
MRKTLETVIGEFLADYPDNQAFRVRAHELWRDGCGWTSNDRFTIVDNADKARVLRAARGRWEVFKVNYASKARVSNIVNIGYDRETGLMLECDYLPFVDIEPLT